MSDPILNPEAPPSPAHVAIYRKDYREPDWLVPEVRLDVQLDAERTVVRATLVVERNGGHDRPLRLAGDEVELMRVSGGDWSMDGSDLVIAIAGDQATIETEVAITPNANSNTISDRTVVDTVTEIIDAKLRYPMSALVGIKIDASQFQSIPTRAYHVRGRIIRVPSNYHPDLRSYDGVWDGTFKLAWTNNPAWIFYDLVSNDRYGT